MRRQPDSDTWHAASGGARGAPCAGAGHGHAVVGKLVDALPRRQPVSVRCAGPQRLSALSRGNPESRKNRPMPNPVPAARSRPRPAGAARAMAARTALVALCAAGALAGCGAGDAPAPAGAGGPRKMPAPEVGVLVVTPQTVALQNELPGRVSALRVAQVRARVGGLVLKRLFREGSDVRAGQALFQIDAASYQAALDTAQAALARAQAGQAQAAVQAEQYQPLVEANAISQLEFSRAVAARKQADADVAGARAALQAARINLDYATVRAPIAGRIGQSLVTEGALVSQVEATQMAVIQQIGSVYVNFTQSTGEVLRLRKALAANRLRGPAKDGAAVRVLLEDGSELPRAGRLLFSDLTVDPSSGQITLRAEVPNPDGLLLPGQYVRVRLAQAELASAILLPQQAVTRSDQGDTVLVVGADGVPVKRRIQIGASQGNRWVVQDGLQPGDRVIVDGFQKMMVPGAPVKPIPWTDAGAGDPAAPTGAAASAPAPAASR